jgi:hypothetical protein
MRPDRARHYEVNWYYYGSCFSTQYREQMNLALK